MIRSPLNLEILLHFHCMAGPLPNISAPAVQEGIKYLIQHELIDTSQVSIHCVTAKGKAYIEHILQVPFPEQHWIVPS